MRSVHGISVAGGTFPAEIWNKFMQVAKGPYCGDFPPPKSTIQWTPFFSKYNSQGRSSSYNYDYGGTAATDRRRRATRPTTRPGSGGATPTPPADAGSRNGARQRQRRRGQ